MYIIINIIIILAIDILSFITLSKGRIPVKKEAIKAFKLIHIFLSLCIWILFIAILFWSGDFADNRNMSRIMLLGFFMAAIFIPRIIVVVFSNLAYLIKPRFPSAAKKVNYSGIIISLLTILLVTSGTLFGRFNFRIEEVDLKYNNLPEDLEGFRIVHISDMHLSSFYRNEERLRDILKEISLLEPDILVNTGDFVTIAWNEMAPFTDILREPESRYGNFAIPGNHDAGTYHPFYNDSDREQNVRIIDSLLFKSGYIQLKDSCAILNIGDARLKIAGVISTGRIPDIIFGDLEKALGNQEADFTILLSHDPNHWYYELQEKNKLNLTLSGHTHGMQVGIKIGKFQWSPVSLLYPAWNGVYGTDNNFLYVNRGLGTISLPMRIGMPPEITVITLVSEN